ncbi:MAG TPA: hypothetical protein VFL82_11930, partial [Thermomicrobiales bacterium]|nr:hypothetical protein [Thermomicrobiales bacterium]
QQLKSALPARFNKMVIEPESVAAAEIFHHDETGAIDNAPGFITVSEKEVKSALFNVLGNVNPTHPSAGEYSPEGLGRLWPDTALEHR